EEIGAFKVMEYQKELSLDHSTAQAAYYASKMNVRRRQLVCDVNQSNITVQAGSMQWMAGDVHATTGIKDVADFIGKSFRESVNKESTIKSEYTGISKLILETTYKYIILIDVSNWHESIDIEYGLFLASESQLQHKISKKANFSSAALGGERFYNSGLSG